MLFVVTSSKSLVCPAHGLFALMPASQRAMTLLCQKRLKPNNFMPLAHFSLEAETSPGAKNCCDVLCALGLVWFSSAHSLCSDYRILCAPHFGGDINYLLTVLPAVPGELALTA